MSEPVAPIEEQIAAVEAWLADPRFEHVVRLYSARQVAEQRGPLAHGYAVAEAAARDFYARLRELFEQRRAITTFGPYSPGQAVTMKRLGIEGIYLGGWATSAKGSISEDPGADLASYPLSQVPDEAAPIVRALLTADRNQHFARSRMSEQQRQATPEVDFRPFIIADADTGHGGDAHVRNLIRRFVEVGVPGYHIEDQKPGVKKCGHQGGKVLVAVDEQIKRLNAARFQLDVMGVPGILVARTDAESATFLESRSDERDQPFILGSVNLDIPSYKAGYVAILKSFSDAGLEEIRGHLLFELSTGELEAAHAWLERNGLVERIEQGVREFQQAPHANPGAVLDRIVETYLDLWAAQAGLVTYGRAVADVVEFRANEGEVFEMTADEWLEFASASSFWAAREKARSMGVHVIWDCEHAKTTEGYYQIAGGIDYAIAKSLAVAPFADILWMETKTADLEDARTFAEAIHAVHPEQMLAYNLSPSFSWDTTGMSEQEMARFPEELGKLGFVFNFITYGGHQIDGLAGEEFATALIEDGMLALARLQRKFRLLESPYRTPQTLVGGPRIDGALMASSGRTATTAAMGRGSTQFQHLVQTEVPPKLLEDWLGMWTHHYGLPTLRVQLRPATAASDLLELQVLDEADERVANVVFAIIQDRRGRYILSVRDQHTFEEALRKKRLMSLVHLFLIHRYKAGSVHYVSPTEDNRYQTQKMKTHRIFSDVYEEVGHIIVAEVDHDSIAELLAEDRVELGKLIDKTRELRREPAEVEA
ncbi:MAG TPA: isocitrate lyase ICL2 [Thermoanaerobaculia bacterium]|nr:isocitrate lyase ICL2 [Thermoanaerobaculia bacterium]